MESRKGTGTGRRGVGGGGVKGRTKRERERETERQRETETETERDRERQRQADRQTETKTDRQKKSLNTRLQMSSRERGQAVTTRVMHTVTQFTIKGTFRPSSDPPSMSAVRHTYVTRTPTPSLAFRHLPPNSARIGYATEEAFFISAQLSTDTVRTVQMVLVLTRL